MSEGCAQRAAFALTAFPFLLSIEIREPHQSSSYQRVWTSKTRLVFSCSVGATNDADHGGDWDLFSDETGARVFE
jgi:hypothetical protein